MITLNCDDCNARIIQTKSCNTAIANIHDHAVKDCGDRILCDKCAANTPLPPCPICGNHPRVSRPPMCLGYEIACVGDCHTISFHNSKDERKVREQWCNAVSAIETFMKGTKV